MRIQIDSYDDYLQLDVFTLEQVEQELYKYIMNFQGIKLDPTYHGFLPRNILSPLAELL